jgi:hypothetical protein
MYDPTEPFGRESCNSCLVLGRPWVRITDRRLATLFDALCYFPQSAHSHFGTSVFRPWTLHSTSVAIHYLVFRLPFVRWYTDRLIGSVAKNRNNYMISHLHIILISLPWKRMRHFSSKLLNISTELHVVRRGKFVIIIIKETLYIRFEVFTAQIANCKFLL